MNSNDVYKVFQLMEFFVTKYAYTCFAVKGLSKANEVFVASKENPNFNLIRISTDSIEKTFYDENRIEKISEVIKSQLGLNKINVLDIHISNEELYGDEKFATVCLNTNFISGEDIENSYPGVEKVIHEVKDGEAEIKKSIFSINSAVKSLRDKAKKKSFSFKSIKESGYPVTLIIMAICILIYLIKLILSNFYSESASLILLGADYKMFTLGVGQFFRLISSAFVHASFVHLVCNLTSFYMVGRVVEKMMGSIKYLIMLMAGILFGSLCKGILVGNSLSIGLSGGVYTIFIYLVLYSVGNGYLELNTFFPTLFLNLALNFVSGVAWQCHLGGAMCGLLFYYLYKDEKINLNILALIILLTISMLAKYVTDSNLKPYYPGTDAEVVSAYRKIGLDNYSDNMLKKLYKIYQEE